MVLRLRVEVAGVEHAQSSHLDVKHDGTQDVAGVVGGYSSVFERAHALPAADADHAFHSVGDALLHLRSRDTACLLLRNNLVVVFKQRGAQCFGGVAHVHRPREAALLRQVQQRSNVVQVEVRHEDAVDAAAGAGAEAGEVREPPVVEVCGVHAHIQQEAAMANAQQYAAAPHLLPCS